MPTFYNFTQDGYKYSFDDIFIPADAFRQGNLWTWGRNSYASSGPLGINDTTDRYTPVTTFSGGNNWKYVSGGALGTFSAGIKTDGTLWTWGWNVHGQLATNDLTTRLTPVQTFDGGTNWKQVYVSYLFCSAIKTDGTLWTWGNNDFGQLGTNGGGYRYTPVQTFAGGTNWKQGSSGSYNVAAIKTDGTLWTWGYNSYGHLGTNDTTHRSTPVTTFAGGTNWKQVSNGADHCAAIKTDGTLWVWGRNYTGKLGTNDTTDRSTPVTTFSGGNNWKQVSCNYFHNAAIKTDGTLWTWGFNIAGQLGINDTTHRSIPVTTFAGGTNWKQVGTGGFSTAAIKTDGTLWTWGRNAYGNLGTNDTTNRLTPVTTFSGGSNWKQVGGGINHCAAIEYIDPVL